MIGRILWGAVLMAIAVSTTALQIDRQSASTPQLAPLVPAPLRAYAHPQIIRTALQAGDSATALAAANDLVRRRPLPAEHLTLLAVAQAGAGQGDRSAFTIQVAAQRGWRDPVPQEAVLRLALDAGDKAEAARRFAALFRRDATPNDLLTTLAPTVLGDPGGEARKTFAGIIAGASRWQTLFLQRGRQVLPPDALSEIAILAMTEGALFDCAVLSSTTAALRPQDAVSADRLAAAAEPRCR